MGMSSPCREPDANGEFTVRQRIELGLTRNGGFETENV